MRRRQVVVGLLAVLLGATQTAAQEATPTITSLPTATTPAQTAEQISTIDAAQRYNNVTLEERDCPIPCGWIGQLCCKSDEYCYTDTSNQAQCGKTAAGSGSGSGYWQYYTSTWIETSTVTRTSVYSSWVGSYSSTWLPAAQTGAPLTCNWASGEKSCGNICCTSSQYCVTQGQCGAGGGSLTTSYSAPLRPTSSSLVVATATMPTTTTVPFIAPVPTGQMGNFTVSSTSGGGSGLSGGAIAGIVIGVLLGIFLLILLCLFLCFKAAWDGLLALFGIGTGRRRKETVEYSSYQRTNDDNRRWYAAGAPAYKPARVERKEKRGFGPLVSIAAALAGLGAIIGLRRYNKNKRQDEKSDYSSSYYSSYYTESSSDRRTADTRRSRR